MPLEEPCMDPINRKSLRCKIGYEKVLSPASDYCCGLQ